MVKYFTDSCLSTATGISHAFFTKAGGISTGNYAGLNCDYQGGDKREHVEHNRRLVAEQFGVALSQLATVTQVHSNTVLIIKDNSSCANTPADAIVTKVPKLLLGALSADCAIVLLAAPQTKVIGIAHAGWKGAKNGILANVVQAMEQLGSKSQQIIAALSPCIGPDSYQVSADFYQTFCQENMSNKQYFGHKQGSFWFDLRAYIVAKLRSLNLIHISTAVAWDTYPAEQQFFSYRRAYHNNNLPCGRQISAIMLD